MISKPVVKLEITRNDLNNLRKNVNVLVVNGNNMSFKIAVEVYKETGKHYAGQDGVLQKIHEYIHGFDLEKLIRENEESVHCYSPIEGGFKDGFFYVVKVEYPNEVNNYCNRMFDKTTRFAALDQVIVIG